MRSLRLLVVGFSLLSLIGCASKTMVIKSDQMVEVEKIAYNLEAIKDDFTLIDHTEIDKDTYFYGQLGAAGGLLETIVKNVKTKSVMKDSLGGEKETLEDRMMGFPIQDKVTQKITEKFQTRFEVLEPNYFVEALARDQERTKMHLKDYIAMAHEAGADLFVDIDFIYGVATYIEEDATAALVADMKVYNTTTRKKILEKYISSDQLFKQGRNLEEFERNDTQVYLDDLDKAIDSFSYLIAGELGLYEDKLGTSKDDFEYISAFKVTCKNPYELSQDCGTFLGAKKRINIEGYKAKISGSAEGDVINIMSFATTSANEEPIVVRLIRSKLVEGGLTIKKTTKFGSFGQLIGIIFEVDGDGYSIINKFSTKKDE